METEASTLTRRYSTIVGAFLSGIRLQRHVLPNWLAAEFDKLYKRTYLKALVLFSRLLAGTYVLPRKRTTPRAPQPAKPPVFTPPVVTRPVFTPPGFAPPDQLKTTGWMWFARLLPTPITPYAATCRAELQQLLSEPGMQALFAQAPALRRHLHPFCRALGVTLPGDPAPPPDPAPAPVPPDPKLRLGAFVHGRENDPEPEIWPGAPRYEIKIIRPWRY